MIQEHYIFQGRLTGWDYSAGQFDVYIDSQNNLSKFDHLVWLVLVALYCLDCSKCSRTDPDQLCFRSSEVCCLIIQFLLSQCVFVLFQKF